MIRYHARWVLPVSRPPIADGTVVEHAGRIAWVGPRGDAPPGDADVDLGDAALMPGLVNAHTHLELTAMRGFLEDLPFDRWIGRLTRARREALTTADLLASSCAGIAEGLLAGITTYADTSESGTPFDAMREMRVRGITYVEVFGPHPGQAEAALRGLQRKIELRRPAETERARIGISPHAPYSVSGKLFRLAAEWARGEGLPFAVHVAESEAETRYVRDAEGPLAASQRLREIPLASRGSTPIRALANAGVLAARPLLIHCVRAEPGDIELLRDQTCGIAHCPASNAKLGHGIAPLVEMLDAGLRVGLGSDSVASNNRMDVLEEARLAVLAQRARTGRPDAVPIHQALELATLGGARAIGLEGEIGSLEPGKAADLAAFPLASPGLLPLFDPVAALVLGGAARPASFVAVGGEVLVRDGRLVCDAEPHLDGLRAAARRLQEWEARHASSGPRNAGVQAS